MAKLSVKFKTIGFFAILIIAGFGFAKEILAYHSSGNLISTNLLSEQAVSSIGSFFASTTQPASTSLWVQFSQDNSNWYSAGNVLNATTSIANGTSTTNLSGLGWSGPIFYYKMYFNTTNTSTTPVIDEIEVIYNVNNEGFVINEAGYVGVGDLSPAYLLTVGSGDLFGINHSGYALLPSGMGGTPSLSFTADTNTGLWSSGADTLNFSTGGSERLRITSAGLVGIGTTTPSEMLTVWGGAYFGTSTTPTLYIASSTGRVGIGTSSPSYNLDVAAGSGIVAQFSGRVIGGNAVNSNEFATLYQLSGGGGPWSRTGSYVYLTTSTDSVGIGTTSPAYTLDVYGNARLGTSTASSLFFRGLANFNDNFYISTAGNVATGTWQGTPVGVSFGGTGTSTNFTAGSVVFASASGIYSQNNANLFWDNTNSRLGIGTSSPETMLHLYGASNALRFSYDSSNYATLNANNSGELAVSGSNVTELAVIVGSGAASQDVSVKFDGQTQDYYLGLDNSDSDKFHIGLGSTIGSSAYLTILSTGNVGIGTTTPPAYAKLTICYTSACVLPPEASTTLVLGSIDDATTSASIRARGTITASLADIGEYVRIEGEAKDYEPGDILEASAAPGVFRKSSQSYSSTLVGPITNASAFIAGSGNVTWKDGEATDAVILSLSGQVQVKVSTENGVIQVGDPLTSASQPGVAMKATAPGRVIGMALESFDQASPGASSTAGKILVFVNSHWYAGKLAIDGLVSAGTEGTTTEGTTTEGAGIVQESSNFDEFIQKVKAGLASLGLTIENGVAQIRELVADKIFAKKARIEKLEMVDKATGEIYCTWIENGEWQKVKGECADTGPAENSSPPISEPPPDEELSTSTEPSLTPPVEAPAPVEEPVEEPLSPPVE